MNVYYELRAEEKLPAPGDGKPAPQTGGGFGYPAETALVNRFEGKIEMKDETPAKPAPQKE